MFLFMLFYFIYFKILINYIMQGSKSLRLNASRLTPRLTNTKTPRLTLSPLKTLVLTDTNLVITKAYISSDGGWFMDGMVLCSIP